MACRHIAGAHFILIRAIDDHMEHTGSMLMKMGKKRHTQDGQKRDMKRNRNYEGYKKENTKPKNKKILFICALLLSPVLVRFM